jgi:hypothetical protein
MPAEARGILRSMVDSRVVILTPEGGQLINMGIGRGYVFTVISQEAAARYAMHRSKLPEPLMITGPAGQQVRAVGRCEPSPRRRVWAER